MTMDGSEDRFWAELRRSVQAAERQDPRETQPGAKEAALVDASELAAAERLLAEVDREGPLTLAEAQIERIVRDTVHAIDASASGTAAPTRPAPGGSATDRRAVDPRAVGAREVGGRVRGRIARLLAAAVALCLTPVFLVGAAVATAAAVTSVMLRNTSTTLSFQDAVRYLVSDASPVLTKNPAQGKVYSDMIWMIQVVRDIAGGDPAGSAAALVADARTVLQRVRADLGASDPFVLRPLPDSLDAVVERVQDRALGTDVRQAALQRLADLMAYGVSAFKEIERTPQPERIATANVIILDQLAEFLQ
jgi:hypothetical protein